MNTKFIHRLIICCFLYVFNASAFAGKGLHPHYGPNDLSERTLLIQFYHEDISYITRQATEMSKGKIEELKSTMVERTNDKIKSAFLKYKYDYKFIDVKDATGLVFHSGSRKPVKNNFFEDYTEEYPIESYRYVLSVQFVLQNNSNTYDGQTWWQGKYDYIMFDRKENQFFKVGFGVSFELKGGVYNIKRLVNILNKSH